MINIENLELMYFSNDEPVPYKLKCGTDISIHPILVKDWNIFSHCLQVLTIRKNEISDIRVIQMKYLDFIFELSKENIDMFNMLSMIVKLSIKEDYICDHIIGDRKYLAITDADKNIKYVIDGKEFDEIKSIILHQNIYDYDDRYIDPEVRKLYEIYMRSSSRNQTDPTLERKKVFVMGKTGLSIKDVNSMSYRMFMQMYATNVNIDVYFARKIIQASSKYEVKEDIIYPLFEKEKDKYEDIFTSTATLAQKGISGAEGLSNLE